MLFALSIGNNRINKLRCSLPLRTPPLKQGLKSEKKLRIKLKLILRQGPWKNIFYGYENAAISPQYRVASS